MGLYQRFILPRLIDLAMGNKQVADFRRLVVPQAQGRVLEIGIGSGRNLSLYSVAVTQLFGLDPSRQLLKMTSRRIGAAPFPVELLEGRAEEIPLPTHSVDSVVSTWSLCSVANIEAALADVRRVLKPGGKFIFVEHGLAPEPGLQRWQQRLTPLWKPISGGCHLDRRMDKLIEGAGFRMTTLTSEYAKGPKLLTYFYRGIAEAST